MMKKTLAILSALSFFSLSAWHIGADCRIVIPEKPYDGTVAKALREGAAALQEILARQGKKVPVVKAKAPLPGKKSIFIGFPDGVKYRDFSGSIRFDKGDIYITGNDRHARNTPGDRNSWRAYYLGSVKALTVFMERFLNVRFVLPVSE